MTFEQKAMMVAGAAYAMSKPITAVKIIKNALGVSLNDAKAYYDEYTMYMEQATLDSSFDLDALAMQVQMEKEAVDER